MKRATNSTLMRQSNRKLILDIIRRQPISRAEIASLTQLTRASVTVIVDELIEAGLLRETQTYSGGVGRHPIHLEIIENARYAAGVNIKRSEVDVGLVNLGGELLSSERLSYDGVGAGDMLERVWRSLRTQMDAHRLASSDMLGIGVCAPGPLDHVNGVILTPPNCDAWRNTCVTRPLNELSGYPALLENVSSASALEEQYFGQGVGWENFLAVQINEGIGAGVVIGDRLYRGAKSLGSELGHTSIQLDGIPCECGNHGCLEKYAAIPALLAGSPYASWEDLMDHIEEPAAWELLSREARYLACALVNAVNLYDVEKIILLGDVSYKSEALLRELNALVGPRVIMRSSRPQLPIVAGNTRSFVRTGAIIFLHDFYQGQ